MLRKRMNRIKWVAENYFSKDFNWDQLRQEVERDPGLGYHLLPYSSPEFADEELGSLQIQDSAAWDIFHARHCSGKFFKERRYLLKEFPELGYCKDGSKILEVGCGNGSTVLAILGGRSSIILYVCDCSYVAIERTKEIIASADSISNIGCFYPFLCDFSSNEFPSWLACNTSGSSSPRPLGESAANSCVVNCSEINGLHPPSSDKRECCIGGVDFVTLIFTLSAIPVERMPQAIKHCFSVLKPGGLLLFRDYGLYDMTMLRFKADQRVGDREYMRFDGTRSYFFCLETIRNLTSGAGFTELELEYCCVKSMNRRKGKTMNRVWVHGKFQKPFCS